MWPDSQRSTPDEKFGDPAIFLGDPQECSHPTTAAQALLNKAAVDPMNIRAFVLVQTATLAAGSDFVVPLQSWNTERAYQRKAAGLPGGRGLHGGG